MYNGYGPVVRRAPSVLGQVGVADPTERGNLLKLTTGLALAGGGVYALMSIPGTKAIKKTALATLGGALLVSSILNVYDALA